MFATPNLVPGQGFQLFKIFRSEGGLTDTGRPKKLTYQATDGQFYGMLVNASEKEIEQGKQNGHPVTHKIISYNAMVKAQSTDCLLLENGRQFYVSSTHNHADLNVFMSYMVEERKDLVLAEVVEDVD
jgi:hypothetical protein